MSVHDLAVSFILMLKQHTDLVTEWASGPSPAPASSPNVTNTPPALKIIALII
jgi:hypothetical protein